MKLYKRIFCSLLLLVCFNSLATPMVPTCDGNITLTSEEDVDEFVKFNGDCEIMVGDLTIQGDNFKSLSGLNKLHIITGDLRISAISNMDVFDGLKNLNTVKSIRIHSTDIVKFEGLNNITQSRNGFILYITNNPKLESIFKINNNLNFFSIAIIENPLLKELIFPNEFASMGGLTISRNQNLEKIYGFNESINDIGYFTVEDNESLKLLELFNNVALIGSKAQMTTTATKITKNPQLEEINSFSGMVSMSGIISITNNNKLAKINSFENLQQTSLGYTDGISVVNNSVDFNALDFPRLTVGSLTIEGTGIRDLSGLSSFSSGKLFLGSNEQLESLQGLGDFTSGEFKVSSSPKLENLKGLDNFTSGSISVLNNENLTSLEGAISFGSDNIDNYIEVTGNPLVESMKGLEGVKHLTSLVIQKNDLLKTLDGLGSSTCVEKGCSSIEKSFDYLYFPPQHLVISENYSLNSISALAGLITPELMIFTISKNFSLESLDGLQGVTRLLSPFKYGVIDNYNLSDCSALCPLIRNSSELKVNNYLPTCDTKEHIVCD